MISKATINEKDPLLYYFWLSVFNYTDKLIELINCTDITISNWHRFAKYRYNEYLKDKKPEEIGYAGLFLNRTNFSGILKAKPLGGLNQSSTYKIDCRFNKERIIQSIMDISKFKDTVEVYNEDAIEFMKQHLKYKRNRKTFVYLDYSVNTSKKGKELLISNMEIPPLEQNNQITLDIG